jgi:hypothetical protein
MNLARTQCVVLVDEASLAPKSRCRERLVRTLIIWRTILSKMQTHAPRDLRRRATRENKKS